MRRLSRRTLLSAASMVILTAALAGCRGSGAVVGASVGAAAGHAAGGTTESTVVGAVTGAVVGGAIEDAYRREHPPQR
ncbi:MAG: glycine zipper 2TM domain-containing protein [Planctomycetota bacterium]